MPWSARKTLVGMALVAATLQNGNTIADSFGKTAGANGTGITGADNDHVVRTGIKAFRQA